MEVKANEKAGLDGDLPFTYQQLKVANALSFISSFSFFNL